MSKSLRPSSAAALLIAATAAGTIDARADQVFADDLIVQGSICGGFDCINNESFGFATLRLKENNTRIDFTDTSVGSFATRDWRIEANASPGGGSSYLAIKDMGDSASGAEGGTAIFTATAGAPANSIFVNNSGNVGFGTATPVLEMSMRDSDTPAVRFEQDGSGGFSPQTWDVAGNEANFFIRDVTGGSRLSFRIRPGAPTSSIDIAADGDVGIGTASPQRRLHIANPGTLRMSGPTGNFDFSVDNTNKLIIENNGGVNAMVINDNAQVGIGTNTPAARLHVVGGVRFESIPNCSAGIATSATGVLSCLVSSRRFKNVAGDLAPDVALANVMALRPQIGAYKDTPEVPEHWLIAEEAAEVDPAFVGMQDGEPYTVKTQNVVADLIAVVQEQQRRIEALEQALAER